MYSISKIQKIILPPKIFLYYQNIFKIPPRYRKNYRNIPSSFQFSQKIFRNFSAIFLKLF